MKRFFSLYVAVMLVGIACANPIDFAKALSLARQYGALGESTLHHAAKASRATTKTPPYYVFSRGEGKGYVIVAGDDCIPSIIGYTESGDFDVRHEAPQLLKMLDYYARVVETLQAEGRNTPYCDDIPNGPNRVSSVAGRVDVPIILTSHWHQSSPYNDRAPKLSNGNRALAGCVAIAGAQVFYHWRRDLPVAVPATTPTYDYGAAPVTSEYQIKAGTPLKWELMLDSYGNQPAEYRDAVATLVAAVGMQTYLEYGESTGGHIWNLPYGLYNLDWKQANKDDIKSDDLWSALIYSDLKKGHPVVYSGYLEDWEGHALVIDGYRASGDLFHFNYGWGGQSDGYYTVKELGSGGQNIDFAMSPSVIYDIHPIKQNLDVEIVPQPKVFASVANNLTLRVANHSTIPASGFYLFVNRNGATPTRLADAQSSDLETVIGVDDIEELALSFTPPSMGTCHLIVTDADLTVLAKKEVTAVEGDVDLCVEALRVEGNAETERYGKDDFRVTYSTKGTVVARIRNESDAGFERNLRVRLWRTDDEGATWQQVGLKTGKAVVPAHSVADVAFSIAGSSATPVLEGVHYGVSLVSPVPSTDVPIRYDEGCDTMVCFLLKTPDLAIDAFEDGVLRFSGHWDPVSFASGMMAGKEAYSSATAYDLTKVIGVDRVPRLEANPNALFHVSGDEAVEGVNVVRDGLCSQLSLTPGHPFVPTGEFHVSAADIFLDGKVGKWHLLTTPFEAQVPDGVIARRIDEHTTSGISGKTTDVKVLEAGKTYLVMTSHHSNQTLAAADGSHPVSIQPVDNADPSVVGTYVTIAAPENAMILNNNDNQSFVFMEEDGSVEALRGYFIAEDITRAFSAQSNSLLDPSYRTLALNIETAYGILEKYRSIVSEESYEDYLETIHEAEREFSNRDASSLNTVAKVNAYAQELLDKGNAYMRQMVRPGNVEVDFTSNIKNPSFELKSTVGWTLTTPLNTAVTASTVTKAYSNSSYNYFTANADGDYILSTSYVYVDANGVRDTLGVGISQEVGGLVPGYYRLTACLASDEGNTMELLAGASTTTVAAHPYGRHYFSVGVVDSVKVEAGADGTGTLTIGVAPGKWYKADNFRLTYLSALDGTETPDAIVPVASQRRTMSRGIYTIQGQRVTHITRPGIYIVDGRKVVVK